MTTIISNLLQLTEVIILAVGAYFAVHQLRLQRKEFNSNAERESRRQSMEVDARLADLAAERRKVESAFPPAEWKEPISLDRLQAAFQADEDLELAVRRLIAQMDILALPVCAKAADEDMAFELVGSTVVTYANLFRNYILHLRQSQNRPDFYIYMTTLVDTRWAARAERERALISQGHLPFWLRAPQD